jgi:ABC-type sugar transport system ATPase subunit
MIELRAVSKSYNGRRIIDTVSLKVETGERVVLFGPSGCGKSTVLHLVAGLITPDAGDILIDGAVVATAGRTIIEPQQRGIGMVFQDLALWPHMTVAQNLEFGLRARGVPAAERAERVQAMVGLVRLGDYLHARPAELSGGQQQRVALARALVFEPRIVLMDEPLSALDEELNLQLRQEILRLHGELGFTLVYVTHSREEAAALATRIVHFRQGQLDTLPHST